MGTKKAAGLLFFFAAGWLVLAAPPVKPVMPFARAIPTLPKKPAAIVPTFHCLSIYWSPEKGEAKKKVLVKFREATEGNWHDGLPMRYNPVETPECKGDYRGSIVNLKPGTTYEVALALEGTDLRTSFKAATWSDKFPVASTIKCTNSASTLTVNQSGTTNGYVLYDGAGCVIDGTNQIDLGISVDASYVILRGFTIRNVTEHGIHIRSGHHIVVEQCDISKWGSEEVNGFGFEQQAGVYSRYRELYAVVVQRCRFHHPNWTANSWAEKHAKDRENNHPAGPQTIVFWDNDGNNVIRYNECWSDKDHYFNDVIGGGHNNSYRGFPGPDSDVYGNYVANCWDDGLEIEGGSQNVRVWNNYIENTYMIIANAPTSIGPLYVWRNVGGRSFSKASSKGGFAHGNFMKMGSAASDALMSGNIYVFNNTVFQPKNEGANGLGGESRPVLHCISRNNILNVRPGDLYSISAGWENEDDDFDYDLISAKAPTRQEAHGIKGIPRYVPGAGFSFDAKTGNFCLASSSPGLAKGVVIPNFCDAFAGRAPDMGAQESGTPPMVFGIKAEFIPPGTSPKSPASK